MLFQDFGGWCAAIIVDGWYLLRGVKATELADRSSPIWQLAAPYGAIILLFGLTLLDMDGELSMLQIASGIVGLLIIGRQGVAIRENRELVERQRDDLIASISHELRTPLTGVTGFTALLNDEWENLGDHERAEMISIVDNQAQHVNRIVTDLIKLARDTLDSTQLEVGSHMISDLTADAIAMVPELFTGKVDLDTKFEKNLEVSADRGRLTQVLVNLLTNAVRYGNGQIRLDAHTNGGHVVLEVHDNGPGVPKRYEETIWERFERGAHRLDASVPGSGIGLPIARSLVEAHGGTILYHRSAQLGGACFTVSVPRGTPQRTSPTLQSTTAG